MQLGLHVGAVCHPFATCGAVVVSVGVGVDVDAEELTADDAFEHLFQLRALVGQLDVGPDLCTRIAQPHGMDVAGVDEGVGFSVAFAVVYGGVQRVGEAVFEHPGQFGVGEHLLDPFDFCFDGGRDVQAVFHCRTVCLIGRCLLRVVYDCGVVLFQDQFGGFHTVRQAEQGQAEQTEGFFHFVYL